MRERAGDDRPHENARSFRPRGIFAMDRRPSPPCSLKCCNDPEGLSLFLPSSPPTLLRVRCCCCGHTDNEVNRDDQRDDSHMDLCPAARGCSRADLRLSISTLALKSCLRATKP